MDHKGYGSRHLLGGSNQFFVLALRSRFRAVKRDCTHGTAPELFGGRLEALRSEGFRQEALAFSALETKGTFSALVPDGNAWSTANSAATFFSRSAASPAISPLELKTLRMAASPFRRSATSSGSNFGMAASVASGSSNNR